eukprot:975061_1
MRFVLSFTLPTYNFCRDIKSQYSMSNAEWNSSLRFVYNIGMDNICDYKCDKAHTAMNFNGYKSVAGLYAHMKKHCMNQDEMDSIPEMFWSSHKRNWCSGCAKLYANCNAPKHTDCIDVIELAFVGYVRTWITF